MTDLRPWPALKRPQPRAPLPANIADLAAQYTAGASASSIARQMNRDATIALQTLRRAGVSIRRPGRPRSDAVPHYLIHREAILRDYADPAVSIEDIHGRYAISYESLYRLVDGAGVARRVPKLRVPKLRKGPLTEDQRRERTAKLADTESWKLAQLPRRCSVCLAVGPGVETCGVCGVAR